MCYFSRYALLPAPGVLLLSLFFSCFLVGGCPRIFLFIVVRTSSFESGQVSTMLCCHVLQVLLEKVCPGCSALSPHCFLLNPHHLSVALFPVASRLLCCVSALSPAGCPGCLEVCPTCLLGGCPGCLEVCPTCILGECPGCLEVCPTCLLGGVSRLSLGVSDLFPGGCPGCL